MIRWLLQSSSKYPDLSTGRVPPGLLTPAEQVFFDGLKSDKRRHDWLLGRWTGKHLVQEVLENKHLLKEIEILAAEDGAPVVKILHSVLNEQFPSLTLSISHSANRAFCGVASDGEFPFGVDIERIENRNEEFVQDYFVPEEIALVNNTPFPTRAGMVTAIWSAKEAALKAIRVGLLADTLSIRCFPQGDGEEWSPIEMIWDEKKLKRSAPSLTGWWQMADGFVLAIATGVSTKLESIQPVEY